MLLLYAVVVVLYVTATEELRSRRRRLYADMRCFRGIQWAVPGLWWYNLGPTGRSR